MYGKSIDKGCHGYRMISMVYAVCEEIRFCPFRGEDGKCTRTDCVYYRGKKEVKGNGKEREAGGKAGR